MIVYKVIVYYRLRAEPIWSSLEWSDLMAYTYTFMHAHTYTFTHTFIIHHKMYTMHHASYNLHI